MDVLVTYDIETITPEGERRLVKVAHICEGFGTRVQYSVFECRLSETRLQRLIDRLRDVIDPAADSVNFYRFAGSLTEARTSVGRRMAREPGDPWVI